MSSLEENKMQNYSSQATLNTCYLVDVAMLCLLLILKKHPQVLEETSHNSPAELLEQTSHNSLGVFMCFSCEKANTALETSASVLCTV